LIYVKINVYINFGIGGYAIDIKAVYVNPGIKNKER